VGRRGVWTCSYCNDVWIIEVSCGKLVFERLNLFGFALDRAQHGIDECNKGASRRGRNKKWAVLCACWRWALGGIIIPVTT
jgi:hypothetical protein